MTTTNEKIIKLVSELSEVKQKIGEEFLKGKKQSLVSKMFRQAFVTMVLIKIKAIDKDYFDGKNYTEVKTELVSKTNSEYDNEDKRKMRRLAKLWIDRAVKKYGVKKGLILTLSCFKCDAEILINHYHPLFKFLSYEFDPVHFALLKQNIKINKWDFMLEPVYDKIIEGIKNAKKDTYSHLLLDFCQSLVTHAPDIELALANDIVKKGGIIWITVTSRLGRGYKGYNTKKELDNLIQIAGRGNYKIVEKVGYGTGAPMYSIIVQRIK